MDELSGSEKNKGDWLLEGEQWILNMEQSTNSIWVKIYLQAEISIKVQNLCKMLLKRASYKLKKGTSYPTQHTTLRWLWSRDESSEH